MSKSKTLLAIFLLQISYLISFVILYSSFLQIPVFSGKPLVWQSLIEQFTVFIPPIIAYGYLGKVILSRQRNNKKSELSLMFISVIVIFLIAFSLGMHSTAQIIEDYFGRGALADNDLKILLFGLDEIFGHLFLLFMPALLLVLMKLEHNRRYLVLSVVNERLLLFLSVIGGVLWGISGLEGGSLYLLVIPISILVLWYGAREVGMNRFLKYPLSRYYFISLFVMILTTIIWIFNFGLFGQPESMGLHLFNF